MKTVTKNTIKKYSFIVSMMIYPAILFFIFYVGVNVNSVLLAFQKVDIAGRISFNGLNNFKNFFSLLIAGDNLVSASIFRSLSMFAINLVICMPLYIIFSFYLYKKFIFYKIFRMIIMIPAIVSTFIICLLFKKFVDLALPQLMAQLGISDNFPKLLSDQRYTFQTTLFYMIWVSFSTSLLVYPNAMNAIGVQIIESAEIDGVNIFQELWHIVLPLIYPTISTFLITGVAAIFIQQGPLMAFYMYNAPPETYNFSYYMLVEVMTNTSSNYLKFPLLAAMGVIITLISAPVTYIVKFILDKNDPTV